MQCVRMYACTFVLCGLQDYKKPLRVRFIGPGGMPEEGQDQGGVSREFFQLLVHQLFRCVCATSHL